MRKLLTIFFLSTMLLLQYSRQVAYLQCKVANALSSKHCDCEKIMAPDDTGDSHDSPATTTSKIHVPDEMFLYVTTVSKISLYNTVAQKPTAFIQHFCLQSFTGELLEPPQA